MDGTAVSTTSLSTSRSLYLGLKRVRAVTTSFGLTSTGLVLLPSAARRRLGWKASACNAKKAMLSNLRYLIVLDKRKKDGTFPITTNNAAVFDSIENATNGRE